MVMGRSSPEVANQSGPSTSSGSVPSKLKKNEASRLFFRMPVRLIVMMGFALAGLVAHTLYLVHRSQTGTL